MIRYKKPLTAKDAKDAKENNVHPNRPMRLVVSTASGGGGDMIARMVAQELSERLGRNDLALTVLPRIG